MRNQSRNYKYHNASKIPGLFDLWKHTKGDPEICIALLDGPVDGEHATLQGANLQGVSAPSGKIRSWHGTLVTSIIFGQHDGPIAGIAPHCSGLVLPVFQETPEGQLRSCTQSDLSDGIQQALAHQADLLNISGGELSSRGEVFPRLEQAAHRAREQHMLIVAATGNEGCECLHVPALLQSVLAVGSMDDQGRPSNFSNWGTPLNDHGILVPGEHIVGAVPTPDHQGLAAVSGTSFATPLLTGIVALMASLQKQITGSFDLWSIRQLLLETAHPCQSQLPDDSPSQPHINCSQTLGGRLNLPAALERLIPPSPLAASSFQAASFQPNSNQKESIMSNEQISANLSEASNVPADVTPSNADDASISESTPALHPSGDQVAPSSCACGASGSPSAANPASLAPTASFEAQSTMPAQVQPSAPAFVRPSVQLATMPANTLINHTNAELVFVLGELSFDFGFEARLDTFKAQMKFWYKHQLTESERKEYSPIPHDHHSMAAFLGWTDPTTNEQPYLSYSNALIWTLNIDATPLYAIRPEGQFALMNLLCLVQFLREQTQDLEVDQSGEGAEAAASLVEEKEVDPVRMSLAGHINGSTRLLNGDIVPNVSPVLRGLNNWRIGDLMGNLDTTVRDKFRDFMRRIYNELRNDGRQPEDRALNYSAYNLTQYKDVFRKAVKDDNLTYKSYTTSRSRVCRKDSVCIDVEITFFDPKKMHDVAPRTFAFTVDVSDIVPISIGEMKQWDGYRS